MEHGRGGGAKLCAIEQNMSVKCERNLLNDTQLLLEVICLFQISAEGNTVIATTFWCFLRDVFKNHFEM